MWIKFKSDKPFIIKIHAGGVNVVSGEPANEDLGTRLRRAQRRANKERIQDYVVTSKQSWLDGIAATNGTVRQFVAMPKESGYLVESQMTGTDCTGGIQLEINAV